MKNIEGRISDEECFEKAKEKVIKELQDERLEAIQKLNELDILQDEEYIKERIGYMSIVEKVKGEVITELEDKIKKLDNYIELAKKEKMY